MSADILIVIVALCVCAITVATIVTVVKFADRQERKRTQERIDKRLEQERARDERELEEQIRNTEIPPPQAEPYEELDADSWKNSRSRAPQRTLTEPFISGGIDTVIRHEYPCGLIVEYDGNGKLLNCIVAGKKLVDDIPGEYQR
jgi:hypothetical protein